MLNDKERMLKMRLLEKLIDDLDEYDASRLSPMEELEEEPEMVENEEPEEVTGEPMARVVEEKTIPVDEIGDYIAEKMEEAKGEEEEEDEDYMDSAVPAIRRAMKARREREKNRR